MDRRFLVFAIYVFTAFFQTLPVDAIQKFEQQPSYTEVNPGQNALLICKVFHKRGSCSWQKDNKPVGMYMHKYEWHGTQETGDCSLWIRAAQLEFDDGSWECQVTASDFHTQDALTSQPVKLVVRVPPQRPRIEYNASQVLPGHNLTALHGEVGVIKCISHYGNPPPVLKWFLDQNEITPTRRQTNSTELDNPRTWLAISILELTISKENHGRTLRCVAVHESYSTKSSSIEVRLDVMFPPETRLVGIPTTDIEELKDSVAIRCMVAANPRAAVVWKREGQSQPASMQELLQFAPVVRQHAGLYTCHAKNKAGESQPIRVHVDVKYSPKILSVGPDRLTTAPLFTAATFECVAEGNPQPTYQWLQRLPTPADDVIVERGREARLHIANVTYDYQGEYVCKVTNMIGGTERTVQSEAIALQVVGAPQVLRHSATPEIIVEKGENAEISLVVCADPRPRVVAWEWGSLRLEAGSEMGRYRVDEVLQEDREDCYLATLRIKDAESTDSRAYYLAVENDRGTDRHAVKLYVNEPLQMSTLVGLAGAVLAAFVILICVFIYAIRAEKCCFARKGDFKPTDLDSQKLDIEKTATTGPGGIPADAIYTTTPRGVITSGGGAHTGGGHHHHHHNRSSGNATGGGGGGGGVVIGAQSPDAMKPYATATTQPLPPPPPSSVSNNTLLLRHANNVTAAVGRQQQQQQSTTVVAPSNGNNNTQPVTLNKQQQQLLRQTTHSHNDLYQSDEDNNYSAETDSRRHDVIVLPNSGAGDNYHYYDDRSTVSQYRSFNAGAQYYDSRGCSVAANTNTTAAAAMSNNDRRTVQSLPGSKRYQKRRSKSSRPKPLSQENDKYYDHIFPVATTNDDGSCYNKQSYNNVYYQPQSSLDHAVL